MNRLFKSLLVAGMLLSVSACTSSNSTETQVEKVEVPDLSGEWKEVDADEDSWQSATITDDTITVYWVSDNGDTESLYWAGTYVAPSEASNEYSWDSENDHDKTDSSLLASGDDTKTFTYKDGILSYKQSALGSTTTRKLEKVEE